MSLVEITQANFDDLLEKHDLLIIDFWANWCAPCKAFAPVFEQMATEYPDILFGKLNTEKEQALSQEFQVRSIPLVMIIKQKTVVFAEAGAMPASAFKELIEQAVALKVEEPQ
ncbi:MAG: thioredoxin [Gammaproteobacteria bacterium]|nr:thioredoxin [Gammaproteobacteria bacterium]